MLSARVIECATVNAVTCIKHRARPPRQKKESEDEQNVIEPFRDDVSEADRDRPEEPARAGAGDQSVQSVRAAHFRAGQPLERFV